MTFRDLVALKRTSKDVANIFDAQTICSSTKEATWTDLTVKEYTTECTDFLAIHSHKFERIIIVVASEQTKAVVVPIVRSISPAPKLEVRIGNG
jgi:hypothetical protein